MFPLRHEAKPKKAPLVTIALVVLCCAVFFGGGHSIRSEGLVPLDFFYGLFHPAPGLAHAGAMLFLSFFMHGSLFHLLGNMWYLWLFGSAIEGRLGHRAFAVIYCLCGVVSMLMQVASAPLSSTPIVGASGAIAGIMGLNLVLLPRERLLCYFPPIFLFRVPAFIFLLLWFFIQYVNVRYANPAVSNVAWWAHIGGYAAGAAAGVALLVRNPSLRKGAQKR
jgi:membrane associated rhomboid family serine protease